MKWAPENTVSAAYLIPVLAIGGMWCLLLFVGNTEKVGPIETLRYFLFEAPEWRMFWFLIGLPTLCLALGAGYLTSFASGMVGAVSLCVIGIVVALAAWLTVDPTIATFISIPLLFSVPRVTWHLTTRSSGP